MRYSSDAVRLNKMTGTLEFDWIGQRLHLCVFGHHNLDPHLTYLSFLADIVVIVMNPSPLRSDTGQTSALDPKAQQSDELSLMIIMSSSSPSAGCHWHRLSLL